jgi:nickel-dependent lactate racemase
MKITLRYGRDGMPLQVADDLDAEVLHLNPLPPLENEAEKIENSLRSPIGSPPLDKLAQGRESACIVICDVTRPVPNEKLLAPLLTCLQESGIAREKITILIATGLHRPNEGAELEEMVGARIMREYSILNHVARDASTQTSIGEVPFGRNGQIAAVAINSAYVRADLKITTGLIEPHLMAGYSGGRKLVCPGVASAETIMQFHSPRMISDPRARPGNLEDNPVHAMSRHVAGLVGMDFICNVTLSESRSLTGVFSGDLDDAHQAGIARVDQQSKVPCRPADIVITTAAGYPLDTTLYQAVKGMLGALPAIKPGGTMILAASLSEGLGGPEFTELCRSLVSTDEFLMLVLQKCEVMVVSDGLTDETLRECLLTPMPSVSEALNAALKKHGTSAAITVIPEGPYVTPTPQIS